MRWRIRCIWSRTELLLELIRYIQLLGQTLMLLFSTLFSLENSYASQCKGNGLQVCSRHPQSSSGWDAVSLLPSPQPASNLVVAQEALLDCELFRDLPVCLCSLRAATRTANRKNYRSATANLSSVRVNMSAWIQGMQLHSCVQWGGLMLILEIGRTTITGLNSRKLLWFLIYERENSIPHLSLTSGILSLLPYSVLCVKD